MSKVTRQGQDVTTNECVVSPLGRRTSCTLYTSQNSEREFVLALHLQQARDCNRCPSPHTRLPRSRQRHWWGDRMYSVITSSAGYHDPTALTDTDSPAASKRSTWQTSGQCNRLSNFKYMIVISKRKLWFPAHQISWVIEWVIEYAIFLDGLAQKCGRESNEIWHKGIA